MYLLASHDESCFKAGQFCSHAWMEEKKKVCMDKSEGPSHHYSCYTVEWGNGCICLDPEGPPPLPIPISELRNWHEKWKLGIGVELPQTADVSMDPGAPPKKQGWWKSPEFWMQVDLACVIHRTVWGDPKDSRFTFVGHYDWSQGHAAMWPNGLNAENMLVGTGGKSAVHLRSTSWPYKVNGHNHSIPRALLCQPGCEECTKEYNLYGKPGSPQFDPDWQSIGVKGLKVVLEERGLLQKGWFHPELLEALQKCSDFAKKDLIERAHVTAQMEEYGYIALFGVKYHAELAHIERKWMMLKRAIRQKLDGKLPTLKRLLKDAWPEYTVHDARKAARHCRDTMRAYMKLGGTDLEDMRAEELKMKGHRRVFDSVTDMFILQSGVRLTVEKRINALRTEKRRLSTLAKAEYDKRNELEWRAQSKRKARYDVDEATKIERDWDSKVRKANGVLRKKLDGDTVSETNIKWATKVLEGFHTL